MAQKVSIVIPNYNGRKLLEKNLPKVTENCPDCEIIVVDDGSTDDSITFLKENFPKIKTIVIKKNKGFANAVNNGVKSAKGKLVLLLNSDVAPRAGFLKPLLAAFEKYPNVFAVGAKDISHEGNKNIEKGRGGATFRKGFVAHFPIKIEEGETLWVSGGSGLFDKSLFLKFGGFDTVFAPFYWEDIDLSYRAQKAGYLCLFEPNSIVDHFHEEGAIKSGNRENYIKSISYKNQFIFTWKNITDYWLVFSHLFWLPYHFLIAAKNQDWPFIIGFFRAALQVPLLILNYDHSDFQLSDKEILKKFEK